MTHNNEQGLAPEQHRPNTQEGNKQREGSDSPAERKQRSAGESDNDPEGPGASFASQQRALDTAYNEKIKSEEGTDKLDPAQANRSDRRTHKTDVSRKKTGAGKQVNPGT